MKVPRKPVHLPAKEGGTQQRTYQYDPQEVLQPREQGRLSARQQNITQAAPLTRLAAIRTGRRDLSLWTPIVYLPAVQAAGGGYHDRGAA